MEEEFDAAGVSMKERGARTDEMIDLLRELWEQEQPGFSGRFTEFPPIRFEPKPVQKRLPVWIGGVGDAALRRVVSHGDGWTPTGLGLEELRERIEFLRAEAERKGRPMAEIALACGGPFAGDREGIAKMQGILERCSELGIHHFRPAFSHSSIDELIENMKVFAEEFVL